MVTMGSNHLLITLGYTGVPPHHEFPIEGMPYESVGF